MGSFAKKEITFKDSILIFLCIIITLIFGVMILKIDLHIVLLASLFFTIIYSLYKGYSWNFIKSGMSESVNRAFDALLIFILIGATIGVWMISGTIPSLIYYGLDMLSPSIFLPTGLIICSLTSIATGTSWGTIGTVGLALMGIGDSLGIPSGFTAGMIVSGAFFGDKISPMSDTTNLAALSCDTNLYDHITAMLYTTIPSYTISLIIYTIIGFNYRENAIDFTQINLIQTTLNNTFNITALALIPMIIVVILSVLKKPAILSMAIGVLAGALVALFFQDVTFSEVLMSINNGYTHSTNVAIVDTLIKRGGIQSMMFTFSLAFIALCLGGVLDKVGYLKLLVEKILLKVKSIGTLITLTIVSCILSNAVMGEAYLSIILNGKLYKKAYDDKNLKSSMLSRSLEEGATLTTGLIPWTTAGAFIAATLGINTLDYVPYTFLNLINPLLSIIFAYTGLFILKKSNR